MAASAAIEKHVEAPKAAQPSDAATSRVCVKNLPKHVDEKRLREHFSAKGEVTDAKIMRTKDGKSRQFGFVGFRSAEEARVAVKYFDKSFMDTSRLLVEFAYKFGTSEAPRAWSRYTSGTSANKATVAKSQGTGASGANLLPLGGTEAGAGRGEGGGEERKEKKKRKGSKEPKPEEEDPKLREFLQLMQPRNKQAIWSNEDLLPAGPAGYAVPAAPAAAAAERVQLEDGEASEGEDDYQELPGSARASDDEGAASGSDSEDSEAPSPRHQGQDTVVGDAAVSDLDYLRSRMRANFDMGDGAGQSTESPGGDLDSPSDDEGSSERDSDSEARGAAGGSRAAVDGQNSGGRNPSGQLAVVQVEEPAGQERQQRQQQRARLRAGHARAADAAEDEVETIFGRAACRQHGGSAGAKDGGGGSSELEELDSDLDKDAVDEAARMEEDFPTGEGWEAAGSDSDEDDAGADAAQQAQRGRGAALEVEAGGEASIGETGRLFVRNLPYSATEADLRELFEGYGEVAEAHLVLDKVTKKSKGFALVQFAVSEDATRAHAELDGSIFMGRLLHILPGKRPPQPPAAAADGEGEGEGEEGAVGGKKKAGSSYKASRVALDLADQKDAQLRAAAGSNRAAWNTLFMRSDTVAEAVAAHYGVPKAELLDREAGDMAVRLALGETHVIAETKRQLGEAGAAVDLLESAASAAGRGAQQQQRAVPRSDAVLLVKNLPYSATEAELEALFGALGPLGRLVLPTTRTLALVEFLEPQDARRAFKALAYKRYQHVPLYLEWAPRGIFASPPQPRVGTKASGKEAGLPAAEPAATAAAGEAAAAATLTLPVDDADADSSTIFVKNLAFATEDAALRKHFEAAAKAAGGKLRAAKVAKRKGPEGKLLSAGYGFVECSSEEVAKEVIKQLQGSLLDGHKLALQLSTHQAAATAAAVGAGASSAKQSKGAGAKKPSLPDTTKMVVRNVAFEATRKDIMGLFTPFGHVKSCRLPRKFDGTHRGFAFVDFATKQEARSAMEAVQGAHLYGRRLVLEWAAEEGGLDELRAKTAAKYRGEAEGLGAGEGDEVAEDGKGSDRPGKRQKRQK
ncbi:hypothetical protein N2152v2_005047 [Parachlorella kessleri]